MSGYLRRVLECQRSGRRLAVVTVVHSPGASPAVGARMYVYEDEVEGTLGDAALDRRVVVDARALLQAGASRSYLYWTQAGSAKPVVVRHRKELLERRGEGIQVYIESIVPPPVLLVFGAGHDAIPVVKFGSAAGFRVVVVDSRPAYARPERFPGAHRVVHAHADEVLDHVEIDRYTYVVLMTHNFNHDRDVLHQIWGKPYAYLGLLGPWERTERLLDALREAGRSVDDHLDKLYAPVGLDIGAEGPEEIALAIVAEVLAVRRGTRAGFLRFRRGRLHARAGEADAEAV